jgi:outer membrane protein TolC
MRNRPRNPRHLLATCVLLVAAFAGLTAAGEELPGHAHEPLPVDSTLTLVETIDEALAVYPESLELPARSDEARAWSARGNSWLSGRPSLMVRYQTDRMGSDLGLDEYEAGMEMPLWGIGGRSAVRLFGDALSAESLAAESALRWEVAGLVRQALWNIALAENDHELAEQAHDTAERLAHVVERRYELGDVALSDVLLARSTLMDWQTALIEANAMLLDAERVYRSMTGLDRRPAFVAESLSIAGEVRDDHPALVLADAAVARAEADVAVAEETTQAGATLTIGTRRERPALGTEFDDSIGFVVSVPFGGESHRKTEVTAAARAASTARARRRQVIRDLTLAVHEAAHGLNVVHQNIETATQRLDLVERQEAMGEVAYEKGELELIDLLKLQANVIAAKRQVTRLTIDEKRQTALYNQAVGELP